MAVPATLVRPSALVRPARLAAVSAAALLALTACGGQQPAENSTPASVPAPSAAESAASASASPLTVESVDYETGTCLTGALGARDISTYEPVDCAQAHNAEYLWAVPAVEEGAEADAAATAACGEQARRLTEEQAEQLDGAVISSSELGNFGTDELHCVVYGVAGEWEGQIVDPEITLESAKAETPAA